MNHFYALTLLDKDFCIASPGRDWIRAHRGKEFCNYCNKVRRDPHPKPVDILVNASDGLPSVGAQNTLCIGIISAKLKSHLSRWMQSFVFGKCFDETGNAIDSHLSFYDTTYVTAVAPENDRFVCHLCGTTTAHWTTLRDYAQANLAIDRSSKKRRICYTSRNQ